ncbi:MAG TPA: cation:proton antiporter [Deltaproteobacteria bacterium]|nr:cation:proton antiporter [Deltaproteobacteria bacterium]
MDTAFLSNLITVFALSIAVLLLFLRLRVPSIIGFLLTGILAGPAGLKLIHSSSQVELVSEFGVVLLLFTIGIEFSLKGLLQVKKYVFLGGTIQMVFTSVLSFAAVLSLGFSFAESIFLSLLVSLSSTAIVLKILDERAETTSPQGKSTLAILIFQDISVLAIMLAIPFLSGSYAHLPGSPLLFLTKGIVLIVLFFVGYRWIVPALLRLVAGTRNSELFLMSIILICMSVAWLTYSLGLSLALGAFLAGLIISESEFSHDALGRVLPFRDVFVSVFFISIGMLLDVPFLLQHLWLIALLVLGVIFLKFVAGSLTVFGLGFPLRISVLVGLALAQIGEFSFVLGKSGFDNGLLSATHYQLFLATSLITMAATPFVMSVSGRIADWFMNLPLPERFKHAMMPSGIMALNGDAAKYTDHLIVVGYGINGRNVSKAARMAGIPYAILEINPDTVHTERKAGEPIYYGDATQEAVLSHVGISRARVLVIAIPDVPAARKITSLARNLNPKVHIIARTRFVTEVKPLYGLGADEVIPEEYETSIEIFSHALSEYLIPRDEIERMIADLRSGGYQMLRSLSGNATTGSHLELYIPDFKISTLKVKKGSMAAGKCLAELELRKRFRVSILAIHRGEEVILNPGGEDVLSAGDDIIVTGQMECILDIMPQLRPENDDIIQPLSGTVS